MPASTEASGWRLTWGERAVATGFLGNGLIIASLLFLGEYGKEGVKNLIQNVALCTHLGFDALVVIGVLLLRLEVALGWEDKNIIFSSSKADPPG